MKTRRLDKDYDISFGRGFRDYVSDADAVSQEVETRLNLFQGEWFLDDDAGTPYFQSIVGRPMNVALAVSIIKQRILDTPGIDSILEFKQDYDHNTRRLTISANVMTIYGEARTIEVTK